MALALFVTLEKIRITFFEPKFELLTEVVTAKSMIAKNVCFYPLATGPQRASMEVQTFGQRYVVYFDKRLGAAHSNCWLKFSFLKLLSTKNIKN